MDSQLDHDLRALNIHIDEPNPDDLVRGYGLDTNQYTETYFDGMNEEDDAGEEALELDDRPPEMPQEFYAQIDSFLNKPPPSFATEDKKKKKTPKAAKASTVDSTLPPVPMDGDKEKKKSKKAVTGKVYAQPPPAAAQERSIDPQLLKEAFEYTDKLLREAVLEEASENPQTQALQKPNKGSNALARKIAAAAYHGGGNIGGGEVFRQEDSMRPYPMSAPAELPSNKPKTSKKSLIAGGMGTVKMIRNLKQRVDGAPRRPTEDFVVHREAEVDLKRNPVDFDTLLANFQSGSTLDKLRKELAESQQNLAQSEEVVRKLTGIKSLGSNRRKG